MISHTETKYFNDRAEINPQAKKPEETKQFLIIVKIDWERIQLGFKKDYLRRLWMNILTVASFPPTHPPTHFLGTPDTSCDLT